MKTALFTVIALAFAVNASAATKITFTHARLKSVKGSAAEKKMGSFNIDYVQIKAVAGQKLSPSQEKVNQLLRDDAKESICNPGSDSTDPVDHSNEISEVTADVTFISPRLIAITEGINMDCGGAHPDFGSSSKVYDLELAKKIDIRTGKEESYENASPVQKAIDKVIMVAMKAQAKKEIAERGAGDECNETYSQLSFYASDITLNSRALVVQNNEPYVSMACQFMTTIPLTSFAKVAPKGSLLAELAAGAAKLPKK
jgi:hypothetical protein